jgi:hypothetical protein
LNESAAKFEGYFMQAENTMSHIRHFIWDFDGTLFDSYPIIIGNLRSALQSYGYDCDPV